MESDGICWERPRGRQHATGLGTDKLRCAILEHKNKNTQEHGGLSKGGARWVSWDVPEDGDSTANRGRWSGRQQVINHEEGQQTGWEGKQ